jgi:endonuclease YncB( thermonuclease family)
MLLTAALPCVSIVHDGDSLRLCDGRQVRLVAEAGPMDAPEMVGSPRCRYQSCDQSAGLAARDRLREILGGYPAELICSGTDKYRRSLCRISVNGRDVGDQMVREGHGVIRNLSLIHISEPTRRS